LDILTHFANFEFCLTAVREKRPHIFKDSFLITANKSLQEFLELGLEQTDDNENYMQ